MALISLSTMLPDAEAVRRRTAWICGLFHTSGLGRLLLSRQRRRGSIPILLYHSIGEAGQPARIKRPQNCFMAMGMVVEQHRFEAQMEYLARHAAVVGLDEATANLRDGSPIPPEAVVLTFDDGFRDNLTAAAPILHKHGFRAAFFPIGSLVNGSSLPWPDALYRLLDEMESKPFLIDCAGFPRISGKRLSGGGKLRLARRLRPFLESLGEAGREAALGRLCEANGLDTGLLPCKGLFMTDNDLRTLAAQGHVVGGHSMSHRDLRTLSGQECGEELAATRKFIESFGGFAPFAYPYGGHCLPVRQQLKQYGFDCGLTTSEGLNGRETDPFALRRIYIGNFGIAEFETHLSGAAAPLLRLARGRY